jgi:hypothetical protein
MSRQASAHPLDTEFLDYVEGSCDPAKTEIIRAHLAECLLCRIKRQRLTGMPPMDFVDVRQVAIPKFGRIEVEQGSGVEPRRGELWLTASDEATMVLIRSVRADDAGVVVVPVTLDIEVADRGALILDDTASPLAVPIAIYEDLIVSLPTAALTERIVPALPGIDLLALREGDRGVSRGSALEGVADPRLEVRQYLVDRLAALDPYESEPDDDERGGFDRASRVAALRDELFFRRGPGCTVEELTTLPVRPDKHADWIGIAHVRDLTVRVIAIETPAGLTDADDFSSAQALITRLDGSALAVCTPMTDSTDLYDAPTLFRAFELPEGSRASAPLIAGLSLADAVAKYLDQKRMLLSAISTSPHHAPRVSANEVLASEAVKAVEAAVKRASRMGPEKREGYLRLHAFSGELARALAHALEPDFDPQSVTDIVEGDHDH